MSETVHIPVSTLRQDLKNAQEHFDRVKGCHTALALQNAERALENFFKHERSFWFLFVTPRVRPVRSDYVAPISWKVIDGGKK